MTAPIKSARAKFSSSGSSTQLFELRYYECFPGKLNDLLRRFERYAIPIWSECGIRPMGFWTTVIGDNDQSLYYMLVWKSFAEREIKWRRFTTDPRWLKIKKKTEKDGPLVARVKNSILRAADINAVKGLASQM